MPIITNLDVMLAKRKMTLTQLSKAIGISLTNLSLLKTGNVKGLRYIPWRRSALFWIASRVISWSTDQMKLVNTVYYNILRK